jgi:hypothetical protein
MNMNLNICIFLSCAIFNDMQHLATHAREVAQRRVVQYGVSYVFINFNFSFGGLQAEFKLQVPKPTSKLEASHF